MCPQRNWPQLFGSRGGGWEGRQDTGREKKPRWITLANLRLTGHIPHWIQKEPFLKSRTKKALIKAIAANPSKDAL